MTTILQHEMSTDILEDIAHHPAWVGNVAGLAAEKRLRGAAPYTYLLRAGEYAHHYYVTYVMPDMTVRHQPFVITLRQGEWYCENGGTTGPHTKESISDVIHFVMHCKQEECTPLVNFGVR